MDFLKELSESIKLSYLVLEVWFDSMGFQVVFSLILLVRGGAWGDIVDIYDKVTPSENWVLLGKKA